MSRQLPVWLFVAGAVVLVAAAWLKAADPVRPDDTASAFARLMSISLSELRRQHSARLILSIPEDDTWKRIRRSWGDPGYVVAAVHAGDSREMYCLDRLGLEIRISRAGRELPVRPVKEPLYGLSVDNPGCLARGVAFDAPPGSRITVDVALQEQKTITSGDLIATAYWTALVKDRIVGSDLNQYVRPILNALLPCGIALLTCGLVLSLLLWVRRNGI